jgi:hypothetical protein
MAAKTTLPAKPPKNVKKPSKAQAKKAVKAMYGC